MFAKKQSRIWRVAAAVVLFALTGPVFLRAAEEASIDDLKQKVQSASTADRVPLCLQIGERQVAAATRFYVAGDIEQAKAALNDVVAFSEQARDYAIRSHKHEKKAEITIRKIARKLADFKHTVTHEDQEQVQSTIDRLDKIRDDLLVSMFPKVGKQ